MHWSPEVSFAKRFHHLTIPMQYCDTVTSNTILQQWGHNACIEYYASFKPSHNDNNIIGCCVSIVNVRVGQGRPGRETCSYYVETT